MGAVTAFIIAPLLSILMLFTTLMGGIKGDIVTKVDLPYNPSEGIVWEYDGVDDPLFDLVKTEINGDKQTFIFKGKSLFNISSEDLDPTKIMDVVFTNKNGEELLYFACIDLNYVSLYLKIQFYSPEEYILYDYIPKEETTVDGAEWYAWGNDDYIYNEKIVDGEKVFTLIFLPDKSKVTVFEVKFCYLTESDDLSAKQYHEKLIVNFKTELGKCEVKNEAREYYDGSKWLSYNPSLIES